jgi:hydroxyacylglutathione hydrolase
MRLTPSVHLVGSGRFGFGLTHRLDAHVYLVRAPDHHVLIDCGAGIDTEAILQCIRADGLDPAAIGSILLTHAHGDHAGGAAALARATGASVYAGPRTGSIVEAGDDVASGVALGRAAGLYPAEYRLEPVPMRRRLDVDTRVNLAGLDLDVIATPGHSDDHVAFAVSIDDRRVLFAGDSIFHSGRILIQNVPDCSLPAYASTAARLATLDIDALLPGHMAIALSDGRAHLAAAADVFATLAVPANVL